MNTYLQPSDDYQRIEQAIRFLEANFQRQPELSEVAASVHLSEYRFQRLFTRWVGISPKRYLQYLTKESAKSWLNASASLLEAAYASGLSGPGRLHDLFVACDAVTPGEFKHKGQGLEIAYGFHPSPFGECLLAVTGRGICSLMFVQDNDQHAALEPSTTTGKKPICTKIRLAHSRFWIRSSPIPPRRPSRCTCWVPISRSRCGKPCCASRQGPSPHILPWRNRSDGPLRRGR